MEKGEKKILSNMSLYNKNVLNVTAYFIYK
jgi:hypothetical protein